MTFLRARVNLKAPKNNLSSLFSVPLPAAVTYVSYFSSHMKHTNLVLQWQYITFKNTQLVLFIVKNCSFSLESSWLKYFGVQNLNHRPVFTKNKQTFTPAYNISNLESAVCSDSPLIKISVSLFGNDRRSHFYKDLNTTFWLWCSINIMLFSFYSKKTISQQEMQMKLS